MATPITPKQAKEKAKLPDWVIEKWNDLIVKNLRNDTARITQDEAIEALRCVMGVSRSHVIENGWLEVEKLFRKAGWKVTYDKPSYNENYSAYFIFEVKPVNLDC